MSRRDSIKKTLKNLTDPKRLDGSVNQTLQFHFYMYSEGLWRGLFKDHSPDHITFYENVCKWVDIYIFN